MMVTSECDLTLTADFAITFSVTHSSLTQRAHSLYLCVTAKRENATEIEIKKIG